MKKLYFLIIALAFAFMPAQIAYSANSWNKYLIGLDPGHGGTDPGAGGPSAPHEAELCLRCATEIKNTITGKLGGRCNMTRTGNSTVSLSYRRSLSVSWDPYIFNSIHLNAFNGSAHGTETWYYFSAGNSYRLAQKVQSQLLTQFKRLGNYSTTNRGVKQNGWTVITGSSNVPAVLTEGLFVDNRTEWDLINNNSKGGFKGWAMGHLMGFRDHLSMFDDNLIDPSGTVAPPTPQPSISVNPTSIKFPDVTTAEGDRKTWEVAVKGANLTADISYSLNNWNNFSVEEKSGWNKRTGGTLIVSFHAYKNDYVGNNSGVLSIKGAGKTINVNLSGVSKRPPMMLKDAKVLSDKAGNSTSLGYDIKNVRNFAYSDGKLYLVYEHKDIKVINARTFADLGNLNKSGVAGGSLTLCDVKECDGKIVACNIATAEKGEHLRLYVWDNDQSNPRVLADITNLGGAVRLGDCLGFTGSWDNGRFAFANDTGSETKIVEYTVTNGVVNTTPSVKKATTDGTTQLQTQASTRVYPDGSGYWIDGKNNNLTRLDSNGKRQYYMDADVTWGNSLKAFTFNGVNYALVNNYNSMDGESWSSQTDAQKAKNYTGGHMLLLDVSDGWAKPVTMGTFPSAKLSDTRQNTNCTGGVLAAVKDGEYVEAWVLSTNQGLAYANYVAEGKKLPSHNVEPIKPAGPALSASASSVNIEGIAYSESTGSVKITGANLTGDITLELSGADAGLFTITPTTIAKATGSATVTITYKPTEQGTHTATITAKSTGAEPVSVTIKGTAKPKTFFDDTIEQLTEKWIYSEIKGNLASAPWFSKASPKSRDIAYANGNLYVLNGSAWNTSPAINILDAYTGAKKGSLNMTDIAQGESVAGSVKALGGKIILSNGARVADPLKVYIWDNDGAAPRVILNDATHGGIRAGEIMSVDGDLTDGRIMFSDGSAIISYKVTNGSVATSPEKIELKNKTGAAMSVGAQKGSVDIERMSDGTYWVTGKDLAPTHFDATGKEIEAFSTALFQQAGTSARVFTFGTRKYAAGATYLNKAQTSLANGALSLVDFTDGVDKATQQIYPGDGFGGTRNTDFQTAVCCEIKDKVLNLWILVCNQGIAHYTYNGEKESGVEGITTNGNFKAYAVGNTLFIKGIESQMVNIYSATGSVVATGTGNNVAIGNLAKGIYIVRVTDVNGNAFSQAFTRK